MRIAQINAVYGIGSTGRAVHEFHDWLLMNGHESLVAVGSPVGKVEDEGIIEVGTKWDHKLHALTSRITGWQGHYSHGGTKRLISILTNFNPHVVILHNLHANYVDIRMLLLFLAQHNVPTVLYLHDCWFFTGKCTHYTGIGCFRWKKGCGCCPKLGADIPSWFFDRTEGMLTEKGELFREIPHLGVVGVSDWVLGEARQGVLSCAKMSKRIYNWIDLRTFLPVGDEAKAALGIAGKMVLCVSSGWKRESKKSKNLAEAARTLRNGEKLVVVGSLEEDDILPSGSIHIPCTDNTEELARLYSAADVYLHLGEEDTFGKVIAEALSCGTPAVTFDSTAYPELVSGECGVCVPTGDIASMRNALDAVLYGSATSRKACRAKAEREFDSEKLMPELLAFIEEVAGC